MKIEIKQRRVLKNVTGHINNLFLNHTTEGIYLVPYGGLFKGKFTVINTIHET